MAMTTRNANRPVFRGRRRGRPKGSNVMPRTKKDLVQDIQIMNVKKSIKRLNDEVQLKHIDTFINGVAMVSNPTATNTILLNPLSIDNTDTTRVGDFVKFTSIQCKGHIVTDQDNNTGTQARLIIFRDRAPNGAAATAAQLLDASVITPLIDAPYNDAYFKRFKIFYDQRIDINASTLTDFDVTTGMTTIWTPVSTPISFRRKLSSQSNYGLANGGTIADISINSYYALLLSATTTASTLSPVLTLGVRMYYKDA